LPILIFDAIATRPPAMIPVDGEQVAEKFPVERRRSVAAPQTQRKTEEVERHCHIFDGKAGRNP
jgi:hypothetical protein